MISVSKELTVTVSNTAGTLMPGLSVYAFDGTTYTNYSEITDENGAVVFSLSDGDYRFRADYNGTQFWSSEANHCTLPGCEAAAVKVTSPVTVSVADTDGTAQAGLSVYAFDGETYSGTMNAAWQAVFTLPVGQYRFRADYDGVPFWSGMENTCALPACEADAVTLPGGTGQSQVTIEYIYDALNRLTSATYSNGTAFSYTYDAAGNVLTYNSRHYGLTKTTTYTYDDANQLLTASVAATATEGDTTWYYTYNSNGNQVMSSPSQGEANGATRNTYNKAGYLVKVEEHNGTDWQVQSEMRYDGLGNRLEMTSYTDGVSETIRYQLDNGQPLAAVGTESTSYS